MTGPARIRGDRSQVHVLAYLTYMRVQTLLMALVAVAAIAVLIWRPWRGSDSPAAEASSAAAPAQAPTVPPPSPPSTVMDPGTVAPPSAAPSQAPDQRPLALARVPDAAMSVVPTPVNGARLPDFYKNLVGLAPAVARLRAEFARAGRPVPPEAKKLINMKRLGAPHEAQVAFARAAFADPIDR
jgi:hypothetical protein